MCQISCASSRSLALFLDIDILNIQKLSLMAHAHLTQPTPSILIFQSWDSLPFVVPVTLPHPTRPELFDFVFAMGGTITA